jgi:hypothetical protein
MLGTVRDTCKIHPMVHDYRMSEAIESLSDLISGEGDGTEFFARSHVTQGMDTLFREGLLQLAGRSDQAAFELAQTMGGGKTHLMVALGLLAKHPHLRPPPTRHSPSSSASRIAPTLLEQSLEPSGDAALRRRQECEGLERIVWTLAGNR